jgi:hypothetical protein
MNKLTLPATFSALVAFGFAAAASAQTSPYPNNPNGPYQGTGQTYAEPGFDSPRTNPVAVTDGTPISTTTIVATDIANSNAFMAPDAVAADVASEPTAPTAAAPANQAPTSTAGVDGTMGSCKIDGVTADFWTVTVPYSVKVDDRSSIVTTIPITVTNFKSTILANGSIGNAQVYGEGLNAGWCYKAFDKQDNVPYRWNITPSAGIYLRRSSDLDMGSWVYNAGISSSFAYQFSNGWIVNLGDSITMAWNSGYRNYPDPIRDQQQVTINGLQVFKPIGRWVIGGMAIDTRYLRTNLVNNFQTYAITAGFRLTPTRSLRFSLVADEGTGYHSISGTLGSSWKF